MRCACCANPHASSSKQREGLGLLWPAAHALPSPLLLCPWRPAESQYAQRCWMQPQSQSTADEVIYERTTTQSVFGLMLAELAQQPSQTNIIINNNNSRPRSVRSSLFATLWLLSWEMLSLCVCPQLSLHKSTAGDASYAPASLYPFPGVWACVLDLSFGALVLMGVHSLQITTMSSSRTEVSSLLRGPSTEAPLHSCKTVLRSGCRAQCPLQAFLLWQATALKSDLVWGADVVCLGG